MWDPSEPLLHRSQVLTGNGTYVDIPQRTSSTAYLPKDDSVVASILERAAEFQGYLSIADMDMQVTSYQHGQEYRAHYDWFRPEQNLPTNRLSTFFAILEAHCENCGTQFPEVHIDWSKRDTRWCEVIDCSQTMLTTKAINGSAVFWRNLDASGRGRSDTLHAGLPVESGAKVGLNIWTNVKLDEFEGYESYEKPAEE